MEMWLPALIAVVITLFFTFSHLKNLKRMEKKALESAEKTAVPASPHRQCPVHRLCDLHDGLPGR
jgi:hypothetical protein